MVTLKNHQIEFIEKDIRQRGLHYQPLEEDILDYICEAVEREMKNGVKFMDAYQKVMKEFGPVEQIQEETINTLNHVTMIKNFIKWV